MTQTMKNQSLQPFDNSQQFKSKQFNSKTIRQKSKSPEKKAPPKIDQLNKWDYCNPENTKDQLPQPYRFVNKVLQEMILKDVYRNIFEIEKHKENPNYEGHLKQLPPQGSFEFDGITFMTKNNKNPNNIVIAGDKFGNILLLDLNKKTQIQRKDCIVGKRIQHIHSQTVPYADQQLTTFCVVARAEPKVYIYRFISHENRIHLNFTIRLAKDYTPDSKVGEFPISAELSQDADFIQICLYSGDVVIYKIPEPPQPIMENLEEPQSLVPPSVQKQEIKPKISSQISFDKPAIELKESFYKIKFQGFQKEYSYEQLMKKEAQNQYKEQEEQTQQQVKKDTKKGGKEVVEEQPKDEMQSDLEFNEDIQYPTYQKTENNADISEDIFQPKFKCHAYFTYTNLALQQQNQMFSKVRMVPLTTGIYVTWSNTKNIQNHKIQAAKPELLQSYLYQMYFSESNKANKQEQLIELMPKFEKKMVQSYQVIYSITFATINASSTYIALGLKEGSIIIWDLLLDAEKCYLDKHILPVTCMEFLENWKLISGSQDGGVHIYNIQKQKIEMKRTNLFKEKRPYSIVSISVSESGVAFVIDSLNNLRMYDMWHSEKIGRMDPKGQLESKIKGWNLFPHVVMNAQKGKNLYLNHFKDQLCIVCEVNKAEMGKKSQPETELVDDKVNSWNKSTNIQIFRIFDALINLFPGLSNVFRRGVDREKIVNLFSRISLKELKDQAFEIPTIGIQQSLALPGQEGSQSNKKSNASKSKGNKSQHLQGSLNQVKNELSIQGQLRQKSQASGSNDTGSEQDLNSSFRTQRTHGSSQKQKQFNKIGGSALTKELLHPEQYLLDKYIEPPEQLNNNLQQTVDNSRKRNIDKATRSNNITTNLQKIKQELEVKEDQRLLKKKKQQLLKD